ncbi:MAG TPA: hypothetical protein VIK39_03405 [Candidatus Angelobacter sp.]
MKTKAHHHWFLLAVAIVLVYHYRAQLLALWHSSVAPTLAAVLPASIAGAVGATPAPVATLQNPDTLPGVWPGLDGSAAGPGVSNTGNAGNLFTGPVGRLTSGVDGVGPVPPSYLNTPGGFGGGAIEQGNSQGGGNAGGVPNSFGNCSTNPRDGKLVCA